MKIVPNKLRGIPSHIWEMMPLDPEVDRDVDDIEFFWAAGWMIVQESMIFDEILELDRLMSPERPDPNEDPIEVDPDAVTEEDWRYEQWYKHHSPDVLGFREDYM